MEPKYIEQLVRRAVQEKFPDSLQTTLEVLKRLPAGGLSSTIPGIGEGLSDAIKQAVYDNVFTVKGAPMDPITELDVVQRLADLLELTKKDFLDIIFPVDNRAVYNLFCKLVSFSISMKYSVVLKKCARVLKMTELMHPLRMAVVNWLRADFCQISVDNVNDLTQLPNLSKDLAAIFISTLCLRFPIVPQEAVLVQLAADWLYREPELMVLVRPQMTNLVCWCLSAQCAQLVEESTCWKLHLSILQGFQQRARSKKHAFLSGSDVKSWVSCIKQHKEPTATDMLLQLVQVALHTQALHLSKDELEACLPVEALAHTEFCELLMMSKVLYSSAS